MVLNYYIQQILTIMKKLLYLFLLFVLPFSVVAQSSIGSSIILASPTGDIHHKYGYGGGVGLEFESASLFSIGKNLPVSFIASTDYFEVGYFDEIENAALPSDRSRMSSICVMNSAFGLNVGTRLGMTAINRFKLYADVFGSIRYLNITVAYHPKNDGGSMQDEYQNLSSKLVPQVGFATGMQYDVCSLIALNLKFSYLTGGPVKLANDNNYFIEENDLVTFKLDERPNSNIFNIQFGLVARLGEIMK